MPSLELNDGAALHYIERGEGEETVVFSHSYLVDHHHFDPQIEALASRYRVVAYDHRGHGRSDKPNKGYSMERVYADGIALLEALDCGPVHWVGLSTGGFVGMRAAFRRPDLLRSLVLMDTSAAAEPILHQAKYRVLFLVLRAFGFRPVLSAAMGALFGRTFLKDPHRSAEREAWRLRLGDNDVRALIGFGEAIFARGDVRDRVTEITLPTMVVVGEEDMATRPHNAQELAAAIPGARLVVIPHAGHLCTVEEPDAVNEVLLHFLDGIPREGGSHAGDEVFDDSTA